MFLFSYGLVRKRSCEIGEESAQASSISAKSAEQKHPDRGGWRVWMGGGGKS